MKNREEILKELREIAPELSKLEKKQLGEVPLNYFSSFPKEMIKKIHEQELAQIAPTLAQQKKRNILQVPESYFTKFSGTMLEKVSAQQKPKPHAVPKWSETLNNILDSAAAIIFKPKYAFAFAGTVSMVIIGLMLLFKTGEETCGESDLMCRLEKVSDDELNAYLLENADEFQKSVLDISTDDRKIQKRSADINDELNTLLNELDDESLNSI